MALKDTRKGQIKKREPQKSGKKGKKRSFRRKALYFLFGTTLFGLIALALLFLVVFFGLTGHVPHAAQLREINNPQASEVYSEDGKLLGRYYIENRSNVTFGEISPNVIQALIATEDSRFYEHRGIDEIALLRVMVKTILLRDRSAGGGSTLSQQIAKNL
ncbi:MAG: peptidoglycan glycosyltransferase, partial [Bacteroidales bacterium]|nr:peptidoglycan glycosyltransferase [Bacteroidales bacterium]